MCLACEQQEYFFRMWCVQFLERGEMPPGVTEQDLQALGLPLPKAAASSQEEPSRRPAAGGFSCDSPDE
jgi:hypothetical protein